MTTSKKPTEKQIKWRKRNRILWRLKGIYWPMDKSVLTPTEVAKLSEAFNLIKEVVHDSVESSIELGFNAKKRDSWGKVIKE